VGQQLEPRRRGGERGEDEERALEVCLGGGGGAGARGTGGAAGREEERGEAEPCAGFGEWEESGGVGWTQRGLEASGRSGEVVPALSLVGQREEPVRGHGDDGHGGEERGREGLRPARA